MSEQNQTNEVAVLHETGVAKIVQENDNFVVTQGTDGKFKRTAKYNYYSSIPVETKEQKIWMMNLLEGDEESGNGLKDFVGNQIEIENIIVNPYDKVNEDTGELEYGVLTYLIDPSGQAYVTSSKTVYFAVDRMMKMFGRPTDEDWQNLTVKVTSKKGQNGNIIGIKLVG